MADAKTTLEIIIAATDQSKDGLNSAEQNIKGVGTATDTVTPKFSAMAGNVALLSGAFALLGLGNIAADIFATTTEFEKLDGMMETATRNPILAGAALDKLKVFAQETPFELDKVVTAFIRLKNLGLDPSEEALRSYGNTSASMGADIMQFIEAIADAATGEFERLKEFGIKAKSEGDQVSFTFQGMTTTVGKNAQEIEGYLRRLGEVEFAGAMDLQMEKLGGKTSNLKDAIAQFYATVGENGGSRGAKDAIDVLTEAFVLLRRAIAETNAEKLSDLQLELQAVNEQIATAQTAGALSFLWGGISGLEEDRAEIQKQIDAIDTLKETATALETAQFSGPQFSQAREAAADLAKLNEETANFGGPQFDKARAAAEKTATAIGGIKDPAAAAQKEMQKAKEETDKFNFELTKLASNERIQSMEFAVQLEIAGIEADTKRVEAAFNSIDAAILSTGETMSSLWGTLASGGLDFTSKWVLQDTLAAEEKRRQGLFDQQNKLIDKQIEEVQLRAELLRKGGSTLDFKFTGADPLSEYIIIELLKKAQVYATGEGGALLLGITP